VCVSLVGAQFIAPTWLAHRNFAHITTHARQPSGCGRNEFAPLHRLTLSLLLLTCWLMFLAGGHRSSVELRPSRNPSSNRRRRCRAGVGCPSTVKALRRCAAYVATPPLLFHDKKSPRFFRRPMRLVCNEPNRFFICRGLRGWSWGCRYCCSGG
jgi:hypothetical protein